jgi:hypothetical protein
MMPDLPTLARRYRTATERADEAREALYAAIREARTSMPQPSWADLARATGLSRERVRQVCE